MNLLVIEPGLQLWGSERAFLATIPALKAAWRQIVVMVPEGSALIAPLEACHVKVEPAAIGNLHRRGAVARLWTIARIVEACRRNRADAIYLNQAGLARIAGLAAKLLGLPLIVHVRLVDDIPRCAGLRGSARSPVSLIFVSEDMRRRYPAGEATEPHKSITVAYDPFELSPDPERTEAGAGSVFACVGRIAEFKGQIELVEGLAIARKAGADLELDVIGAATPGDPYQARLEAGISSAGLAGQVRLLGYRHDASQLMSRYRFMVSASRYESLGRVVFEAWDAGAAPICSRQSGGAAEVVSASGGGLLYDGHDPQAIAEALLTAARMPEPERAALVARGRAWAVANLCLEAYRSRLRGILFPHTDVVDEAA